MTCESIACRSYFTNKSVRDVCALRDLWYLWAMCVRASMKAAKLLHIVLATNPNPTRTRGYPLNINPKPDPKPDSISGPAGSGRVADLYDCIPRFRPHFPHRGHHGLYWDVLQLQCSGLWFIAIVLYLWETTDAWSLRQLQLACAFGVRLPSVFRVDWSDSWLSTYQMSGGRRLLWVLQPQSVELRQAA